jgi:hypothetical protein
MQTKIFSNYVILSEAKNLISARYSDGMRPFAEFILSEANVLGVTSF